MVKKILDGDKTCAIHIAMSSFEKGLDFYSEPSDFIQVGTWNYDAGKNLLAHRHNKFERISNITQEVLFIKSGSIKASIFGMDNKLIDTFVVKSGDILIVLEGGHGYEILENDTQVLEVKNGPYYGPDQDRYRL